MELSQRVNQVFRLTRRGKLADARKLYRALAKQAPEAPSIQLLKGVLLSAQGSLDEAIGCFQTLLLSDPENPTLYFHLGETYRAAARPMDAILAFRQALPTGAGKAQVLDRLVPLYQEVGRDDLAIAALQASLLDTASSQTALRLANLLRAARRFDEAIASYRQAIALDADNSAAAINLAFTLYRQNRLAECRAVAQAGLARFPGLALLHLVLSKCDDLAGEAGQGLARLKDVSFASSTPHVRQQILFHLGRLHDRAGDPREGFNCLEEANALQAQGPEAQRFSRQRYLDKIARLKAVFTADWVQRWTAPPPLRDGQESPAFLVGFPRSGTTLLDQILDAHPKIQVMDEFSLIPQLELKLTRELKGAYPEALATMTARQIQDSRDFYFAEVEKRIARIPGTKLIDKLPLNAVQAGLIHRLFPDAQFIFALRHPCDCVLSTFMVCFAMNDAMSNFFSAEQSAHFYDQMMTLWAQYQQRLGLKVVTHRYEDLIEDLEGVVAPILTALGLDWDAAVTRYADHARAKGAINTPSFHAVVQPLYSSARYRWLRYAAQMEPARRILAPHIETFGYAPSPGDERR